MPSPKRKKSSTPSSSKAPSKLSTKSRKSQKKNRTKPPSSPTRPRGISEKVRVGTFYRLYEQVPVLEVEDTVIRNAVHAMWDQKLLEVNLTLGQKPNNIILKLQRSSVQGPPWVDMNIAIDEQTTLDAIQRHWPTIKRYREALCKVQGPWNLGERVKWCQLLIEQREAFLGYRGLAKFLNRTIEMLLKAQEQAIKGEAKDHQFGERAVLNMMTALGFAEEAARGYCEDALADIRAGKAPIWARGENPYTEPIDLQQVRKKLQWYLKHYPSENHE